MNEYVADAHVVVWYLFASSRLGKAAKAVLHDAEAGAAKIYLPAVAIAEMVMVVEKKRLPGAAMRPLINYLNWMQSQQRYELLSLHPDLVLSSRTLTVIPEIFDRLIVADALRLGLPLITRDTIIQASGIVPVVWD